MSIDKFINLLLNGTLVFTVGYRKLKYSHVDKRLRKQSQIRAAIKTKHANVSFCFTRIRVSSSHPHFHQIGDNFLSAR